MEPPHIPGKKRKPPGDNRIPFCSRSLVQARYAGGGQNVWRTFAAFPPGCISFIFRFLRKCPAVPAWLYRRKKNARPVRRSVCLPVPPSRPARVSRFYLKRFSLLRRRARCLRCFSIKHIFHTVIAGYYGACQLFVIAACSISLSGESCKPCRRIF